MRGAVCGMRFAECGSRNTICGELFFPPPPAPRPPSRFFPSFATMELIRRFFPDLTPWQDKQLSSLFDLYAYWNERINLISRKDIEHLEERHILHSLAIAKIIQFEAGTRIMDVGTGGGFPGIPLAILFPKLLSCWLIPLARRSRW